MFDIFHACTSLLSGAYACKKSCALIKSKFKTISWYKLTKIHLSYIFAKYLDLNLFEFFFPNVFIMDLKIWSYKHAFYSFFFLIKRQLCLRISKALSIEWTFMSIYLIEQRAEYAPILHSASCLTWFCFQWTWKTEFHVFF